MYCTIAFIIFIILVTIITIKLPTQKDVDKYNEKTDYFTSYELVDAGTYGLNIMLAIALSALASILFPLMILVYLILKIKRLKFEHKLIELFIY